MYTLFISDLHLAPTHPELINFFLSFLQSKTKQADALYILGDFFEVWVGDDDKSEFAQTIIAALKSLTSRGLPVYFMHGNRDFLIGSQFLAETGCQLLADPSLIDLYGVPTLLMHGDTLCTQDMAYLRFREKARNPFYQRLFLSLPLFIRNRIARYLRNKSSQQTNIEYLNLSDAAPTAILEVIQQYQAEQLIHGHTHRPCIQTYYGIPPWKRIVLSDWHAQGNALICFPDKTQRLLYFP